jgi:hypothetical protein
LFFIDAIIAAIDAAAATVAWSKPLPPPSPVA